jgi:hypothetical protein
MAENRGKESLPRDRAFVVQFGGESDVASGPLAGRAEHIASGKSRRFGSLTELLTFIANTMGTRSPASGRRDGETEGEGG